MPERWFSDDELREMSRPTMDRAIEALDRGDTDEAVGESQRWAMERYWKRSVEAIDSRERKEIVQLLAATWRAHSTSGVGPKPGAFEIEEDDEKVTSRMNPCGSGQRLWRMGRYEGDDAHATMDEAHDWAYNRKGFPTCRLSTTSDFASLQVGPIPVAAQRNGGGGTPSCRQIPRPVGILISPCRGTAARAPDSGFSQSVCRPPSRSGRHP